MLYLALEIAIVLGSIGVAVVSAGRSVYWKSVADWERQRADVFYRQYVRLVRGLDEQDVNHEA